jgi:hypothetical protein
MVAVLITSFYLNVPAHGEILLGEPMLVPVDGVSGVSYPQVSHDGLELYFASAEKPGQCLDIWVMRRPSADADWGVPIRLDAPVNSPAQEVAPCLSPDGLELYFSDEASNSPNCQERAGGYGKADLWVSKRTAKDAPWGEPENLGTMINTAEDDDAPSLSADGLSLYFMSSLRADTYGTFDIYVSTRASTDEPWGPAENLGAPVNTSMAETVPIISPDGLSLYFSMGFPAPAQSFKADVYVSRRASLSDPWGPPRLFDAVQIPGLEFSANFCDEESSFYFINGSNMLNPFALWKVEVTPVVDFNADGAVDTLDVLVMLDHWGQFQGRPGDPVPCDIAPLPFGDGVVDAQDLLVLAEHMIEDTADASGTDGVQ